MSIKKVCTWKKADTAKSLASFRLDKVFSKLGIGASAEDLFGEVPATYVHAGDVTHTKPLRCDAQGHGIYIIDGSLTVDGAFTFYTADAYTILVVTCDLIAGDLVQAWDTQLVVLGATKIAGLLYLDLSDAGFAVFRGPVASRERYGSGDFAKAPKGKLLDTWTGPSEPAEIHAALVRGDSFAAPATKIKTPNNAALAKMSIAEVIKVPGFSKMMFEGETVNPNWFVKGKPGCALESLTIGAAHIAAFPGELGSLTELVLLYLDDETKLATMLRSLPVLRLLKWLRIANSALTQLPDELGTLADLEVLELSGNAKLKTLPADAINGLGKLRRLVVDGSPSAKLPKGLDLERIRDVSADGIR